MDNNNPGGRYFGGAPGSSQFSAPPSGGRGRDGGGSDVVGPNDPLFNPASTNDNDADRDLMKLPKDAKPPGAQFDPVTPLQSQPAGPNKDELRPPGSN